MTRYAFYDELWTDEATVRVLNIVDVMTRECSAVIEARWKV
ncbi:hypothetical protein ACUSIJ_04825 [Pseudochelatococcus sp. B33]